MSAKEQIQNILLCEDVREEINHKRIIIGVYSGDILVKSFPARLAVTAYIEHRPQSLGKQKLEFVVSVGEKEQGRIELLADTTDALAVSVVPFPKIGLTIEEPAEIRIDISMDGGKRERLLTKGVREGEVPMSFPTE
jgi:Family of unknown function (DUF6941)